MSSNQPDDGCGEVYGGEEVAGSFVVASGDGAVEFEFGKEVFDQVPLLIEFFVVFALLFAVGLGWDHCGFSCSGQGKQYPLIGVKAFIGEQNVGLHERQQHVGSLQFTGLPRREMKSSRVAECIHSGVNLGAQAALAASDGLVAAPFLRAPELC